MMISHKSSRKMKTFGFHHGIDIYGIGSWTRSVFTSQNSKVKLLKKAYR
jgi:hypothetical protein